eukprot:6369162-Prorocentrum_lima.AAC.1
MTSSLVGSEMCIRDRKESTKAQYLLPFFPGSTWRKLRGYLEAIQKCTAKLDSLAISLDDTRLFNKSIMMAFGAANKGAWLFPPQAHNLCA